MEKIQLFSVVLLFVMLFSVVATAVYFAGGSKESQKSDDAVLIGDIKGFKADGISTTVQTVLPVLVIQGKSKVSDITKIEDKLRAPNAVIQVFTSGFLDNSKTPLYFGIVKLKSSDDILAVANELSGTLPGVLDDLAFFKKGIVSIPESITLTQVDNNAVTQTVSIPNIETFMSMKANENSDLKIDCSLQMNISTKEISQPLCVETPPDDNAKQPTGFQIIKFATTANIVDLNNTLTFSHKVYYDNMVDTNAMIADFEALNLINNAELVSYSPPVPKLVASANFDDNSIVAALGVALTNMGGITNAELDYEKGRYTAELDFNPTYDLNTIKENITTVFADNNLTVNINDSETAKDLNVYLHFDSDDVRAVADSTRPIFEKYAMNFDLARIAYADLPGKISDKGIAYTLEDNEHVALVVALNRKNGDLIDVTFFGITSGPKITSKAIVKDTALN